MRSFVVTLLTAVFATAAIPLHAQEAPIAMPTRDVSVTYRLNDSNVPDHEEKIKFTFADDSRRVRLDLFAPSAASAPYVTVIYDQPRSRFLTLVYASQEAIPADPATVVNPGALFAPGLHFTRQGGQTVLGVPCANWRFSDAAGSSGIACVSEFGLVLRLNRTGSLPVSMEATGVVYDRPATLFDPPSDLHLLLRKQHG